MNDYFFQEYITGDFIYAPLDVRLLEIWQYDDGSPEIIHRILRQDEKHNDLSTWLNSGVPTRDGKPPTAGLRLLLDIHSRSATRMVPFSRETFARIIHHLRIPKCLPKSLKRESAAHFVKFNNPGYQNEALPDPHIGYILRAPSEGIADWTLGLSFDPGTRITCGVMMGLLNVFNAGEYFVGTLIRMAHLVCHPLLVPFVIAIHRFEGTETRLDGFYYSLVSIEKVVGHHSEVDDINPITLNFMHLTKQLSIRSREADICEERVHLLLALLDAIDGHSRDPVIHDAVSSLAPHQNELQESIKYIRSNAESMQVLVGHLQRRIQRRMTIVYNFMAQRDNYLTMDISKGSRSIAEASRQDSSSMKAIALLTMLFLPMTFVSTLFSTPIFHWDPNNGHAIVTHNFWIYWAVSLPLTILVLIIWFLWMHFRGSQPRFEDRQKG